MSWLDDAWSAIAPIIPTAINAGARVYGANVASDANTEAARIAADAQLRGTGMQVDALERARAERAAAAQRGIAAIRAGTGDYQTVTAPLLTERPVMLPAYRGLTTQQQIALDDTRRNALATVAASGIRGSAAGVRSVMDQDRRFRADAAAKNDTTNLAARQAARASADSARSNLGRVLLNQGTQIANTETQTGNTNASGLESIGAAQAAGATGAANLQAQAGINNANIMSDTIGALGSIIADSTKRYARANGGYDLERSV